VANPWLGIALVLGVDACLISTIWLIRRIARLPEEVMRKLIHLSTTAVSLSFPWVFPDCWPPALLAGVAVGLMALARAPALQGLVDGFGVGDSLRRDAWGEFYYPASIALLFAATLGKPLLYVVPLFAIGFGDASAAVIGKACGRLRYRTAGRETKSVEGSLAFVFVSFAGALAALGGWSGLPPAEAAFLAITVCVYMALLEAIAWHGLDNLLSPFGGLLVLMILAGASADALLIHASLVVAAAVFAAGWLFWPRQSAA
jgi:dolichol kinase